MTGESYESTAESYDGAGLPRDEADHSPTHSAHTPRFTRAYAEVVRELLAGRYAVGDAIDWESSPRRRGGGEPPIVGAGGPGLLLEGIEVTTGAPVSVLILDPFLWPDDEAFHAARIAANRLSTVRDPTLILPKRVLWEVSARCIVLVLDPVPPPPHRGPGEASLDEHVLRRAGVALCKAARTLTKLGQGGITCDEVWFNTDGQVRVLRVPGIRREPDLGAAQGVASVVQRMLDGAGITPDHRLSRALRRARATPRYEDAESLDVLQRALGSRRAVRAGATAAFLCAAAGLIWLGTGLTWVDADETVVVVNAGGEQRTLTHGLHLKWPTPIESTRRQAPADAPASASIDPALLTGDELATSPPEPAQTVAQADAAPTQTVAPKPQHADAGPAPVPLQPLAEEPPPAQEPAETLAAENVPDEIAVAGETPADTVVAAAPMLDPAPVDEPAAALTIEAPTDPYPAARLGLYYARGSVEQARAAVVELAARFDDLADRRAAAAQLGDDAARADAAETLRIFALRGVDALWLSGARMRIHQAEDAVAEDNAALALQALDGLLNESITRLQAITGAETAAAAVAHAREAEQAWLRTSEIEQSQNRDRAEQALATIAAGRTALSSTDLAAAAEQLNAGALALEQIASQSTLAAARQLQQRSATLLEQWDLAWGELDALGFPAPDEIARAHRQHQTGLEHLQLENPTEAMNSFIAAADMAERRLARLAEERETARRVDHRGRTPLHLAAIDGDVQRARYALALNAPVHARDIDGNSPLRLAVIAGHLPVARVLLESGADVNDRAGSGRPLVFDAARNPAAFILLLDHGARPGWTVRGSTLLHEIAWARARHGVGDTDQVKMAAALLDRGADLAVVDASGETPLQIAERTRAAALADFLRKRAEFGRDWEQAGSRTPSRGD